MPDKKISELDQNPSISGTEEMPTERGGANYKNTFNSFKTWILTGLGIGVETLSGDGVGGTATNPVMSFPDTSEVSEVTDKKYVTDAEKVVIGNTSNTNTGDQDLSAKIESTDYAVFDTGGTLKARLDGTDLYLTNDGTNA